jgi:hypothetical protein
MKEQDEKIGITSLEKIVFFLQPPAWCFLIYRLKLLEE